MKYFLYISLLFITSSFGQKNDNGFEIFIDTCKKFQENLVNSDSNVWGAVNNSWDSGDKIKFDTLRFVLNQEKYFEQFKKAANSKEFFLPDIKDYTINTDLSYLETWS